MKIPCVLFVLSFLVPLAAADTKIPASVFRAAQFEEAAAQAMAQRKVLAVILSQEGGESGTNSATEEAFKELAGWTVMVFVESDEKRREGHLVSPPIATALYEGGSFLLPRVLLCPPSADEAWTTITAQKKQSGKELRKVIKERTPKAKERAAAHFREKTAPPFVMPGDKQLSWGMLKGGAYRGKFIKLEKEQLFIAGTDGKVSGGIPLTDLAPATRSYAKLVAGAAETAKSARTEPAPAAPPAPAPAAVMENWQNKDGKIIRAAFVALKDNMVTIRTDAGKEFTLPLDSLALTSQVRARELEQAGKKK